MTTTANVVTPLASGLERQQQRRWRILFLLGLAQLMVVLDATIVTIALPTAQRALHFSTADRQWIVTAYSLAFGGLLLVGGRLSDFIGRKQMFIVGLIGFATASAIGGAAQNYVMLVIARGIQGAFGAVLAPAALSLLTTTFTDSAERGKAFGVYGAVAGGGGAVGLLLGGLLTEYLSWRWCLYVNIFFAIIAITEATLLLVRLPPAAAPAARHIDVPGTVTAVAGLVSIVYGFSNAETRGWHSGATIVLLVLGVFLLGVFSLLERRTPFPLLPPRVVRNRNRSASYLAVLFVGIASFGVFLFLTYYLQDILRYSPVRSGASFLPMIGALMLSSTTSNAVLLRRTGPRFLVGLGMLIAAGGMGILTRLGVHSSYVISVLPALVLLGIGIGMVFGTALNTATLGTAPADAGVASALVNTCQQIGGSIGTSLLNTIAASSAASYLVGRTPSAVTTVQASVHGDVTAFTVALGILLAAAVICTFVYQRAAPRPGREPNLAIA